MVARDVETTHRLHRSLAASGVPELQNVDIGVRDGRVVLRGSVGSYYQKQLAQETARIVPGVDSIKNEIVVRSTKPLAQ